MKILVGTLYSGENEYEECLKSINIQSYKYFTHFTVKNLPNKQAHWTLFNTFIEQSDKYDILIKVDADMVICRNDLFSKIVTWMEENSYLDVFSVAVHDFFSGQFIQGLNTYRNTTRWDFSRNTIFVDIPNVPQERTLYDETKLAPAAIHCKNPSKYQAFHYGVHRGFKSIAKQHSTTHWALLEKTWQNFLLTSDERIGLAVLGAELIYAGKFSKPDIDYTNPKVKEVLKTYEKMNSDQIKKEIQKLRLHHWGILPGNLRRIVLQRKSLIYS